MNFDPTVGGNSYVSVDEADAYFEYSYHNKTVWEGVDDKEACLLTASSILDWYTKWKGEKVDQEQSLHWPANGASYSNGMPIPNTVIPNNVKTATLELAISNVSTNRVADDDLAGIQSLKAGPLSLTATGSGSSSTDVPVIPAHVTKIVSGLVAVYGNNVGRLYRG